MLEHAPLAHNTTLHSNLMKDCPVHHSGVFLDVGICVVSHRLLDSSLGVGFDILFLENAIIEKFR